MSKRCCWLLALLLAGCSGADEQVDLPDSSDSAPTETAAPAAEPTDAQPAFTNVTVSLNTPEEARKTIEERTQALGENKEDVGSYFIRALAYRRLDKLDLALADLEQVVRLDPKNRAGHRQKGDVFYQLGQYGKAIAAYSAGLEQDEDGDMYYNRGVAYGKLGMLDRAVDDYTQAIRLKATEDPSPYFNRAMMLHALGQTARAINDMTEAIRLDAGDPSCPFNRGLMYEALGLHDKAIDDFTTAITLDPNEPQAFLKRGGSWHALGQYAEAIKDFSKAIAMRPNLAAAYRGRGLAYHNLGDKARAQADFTRSVEMEPESVERIPAEYRKK